MCGGFTPTLEMIKKSHKYNLKVMMACVKESSIGVSAIAHLLPLLDLDTD